MFLFYQPDYLLFIYSLLLFLPLLWVFSCMETLCSWNIPGKNKTSVRTPAAALAHLFCQLCKRELRFNPQPSRNIQDWFKLILVQSHFDQLLSKHNLWVSNLKLKINLPCHCEHVKWYCWSIRQVVALDRGQGGLESISWTFYKQVLRRYYFSKKMQCQTATREKRRA